MTIKMQFKESNSNSIDEALSVSKGISFFVTDTGYYLRVMTSEGLHPVAPKDPPMLVQIFNCNGEFVGHVGKRYESLTLLCMRLPTCVANSKVSPIEDPVNLKIPEKLPPKQFALSLAF